MKWTGKKYVRGRSLEETLPLIRKELEAIAGLKFELHLDKAPNPYTGGVIVVEVLKAYGDRVLMGAISDLVNDYNYSANDPAKDHWDMGFNVYVRPKPPRSV